MAKTLPPGSISIPGVETPFVLNAVPDIFDERDLEYRPRLEPLPTTIDRRDQDKEFYVLTQFGNSCTGHAVAGVVNTIYARQARKRMQAASSENGEVFMEMPRLSPYMLYYLARRYDEFEGEEDLGSSLRGAFKGWFHHGLCFEHDWPDLDTAMDLDDLEFKSKCRQHPLGAYYRINPYRLDDMQSAISELDAIAVSAAIHDGWITPVVIEDKDGNEMHIIARSKKPEMLGGHAFILVGYNHIGFLVQNSWGKNWGKNGFATLPYEDWLDSAYDAWVARPGVPQTPFYTGRSVSFAGTKGALVLEKGPNVERLTRHIVNLGNDGRFSVAGKIRSSPRQVERIFDFMDQQHTDWIQSGAAETRHILLYAHGGMVSESDALKGAQSSLNWWLNNQVFPIYFAWQTGASETLFYQIVDVMKAKLPAGGLGFDLEEQFDRLVEKVVGRNFVWAWEQMKGNARAASEALQNPDLVNWTPDKFKESIIMNAPGATLVAARLARYVKEHGPENVAIHLVGHSAGSVFHAALLQRLVKLGVRVESIAFLAGGLRVDEFSRQVLPHLGPNGMVNRFTSFVLSDQLEMGDSCGQGGITIYHKSLLYLVSRALERPWQASWVETPLIGLERSYDLPLRVLKGKTLRQALNDLGGALVVSRSQAPADLRCEATTHGAFDNDPATMTSVLLRALGINEFTSRHVYQENAILIEKPTPVAARPDAQEPFSVGGTKTSEPSPQPMRAASPGVLSAAFIPEESASASEISKAADASAEPTPSPDDCPILEVLEAQGYTRKS